MQIRIDDLTSPEIAELLNEHLQDMYATSPPESVHALDLNKLRKPEITFWSVWDNDELVGCGAIKELDPTHAEIKSMRSSNRARGTGVGKAMLEHILAVASQRNYQRLSLETGAQDFFIPARTLYERYGFEYCEPFADYKEDPYSVFMTRVMR
ncbi:MAG TPA: GNAT family N-acetyltransferase [Cellvibrio sp.]